MNIALCSPNKNVYSETFIRAHKEKIKGEIFYYYDGELPTQVERGIVINSRRRRIIDIFKGYFHLNRFSLAEQALIKSFQNNRIDKVLAEYGPTGARVLPICLELSLPLVVHFHGFDAFRKDILRVYNNYERLFSYASYIVVVSQAMYDQVLRLGCPKEKLVLNIYGPRDEFLEVFPKYNGQQFMASGRFVDKKAPYYLVFAFQKVLKLFPDARLVIAGNGPLWNTCKNLISYLGMEQNIFLPGVLTKEEIIKNLLNSVGFLQHSITAEDEDQEGTPLSILEASAIGLPVISTIHGGIPDVIIDGKTGILVKEHDVERMADAIITLLESPDLSREMGGNGKKNIRQNFNLENHIKVIDQLLEKA